MIRRRRHRRRFGHTNNVLGDFLETQSRNVLLVLLESQTY